MKVFKGYLVAGNGYTTDIIARTTETFNNLEDFIQTEECFKEWIEENYEEYLDEESKELDFEKVKSLDKDTLQNLMDKYNEGDELEMYYHIDTNVDNTKEFLERYNVENIEEAIAIHKEYDELLIRAENNDFGEDKTVSEEIEEFEKKYDL